MFAGRSLVFMSFPQPSTTALVDIGSAKPCRIKTLAGLDETSDISWVLPARRFPMWSFKTICTRSHSSLQISR